MTKVFLSTSLKNLTRIGEVTAGRLKKLGLTTVEDLLFYYPHRYSDFTRQIKIGEAGAGMSGTIEAQILSIKNIVTRYRRQSICEATVSDETGELKVVWFNQPYLVTQLKPGDRIFLAGTVEFDGFNLVMRSPEWERFNPAASIKGGVHTGRLVPVYPLTAGLTEKQLRFLMSQAIVVIPEIGEWLTDNFKFQISNFKFKEFKLLNLQTAIRNIHFPENQELLAQAQLRLKFEELFWLQLKKALTRHQIKTAKAPAIEFKEVEIKKFVQSLPFKLTNAQRKVAWQILLDLKKDTPMNRLLQGDVGSGKTIVALMAMLNVALNGHQSVLMAPTEILAKQHFATISKLLREWDVSVGLVTRSSKERCIKNKVSHLRPPRADFGGQASIKITDSNIIIGTHALIQENIKFKKLGLVVVDEQHRFGVEQRKALREKSEKGISPHFLSMTATPIPRSLALTMYSDLDLSILDELPAGRKSIITKVVAPDDRPKAYDFINEQIKFGRQVFVICPLIDESDKLGVKAVTTEFAKLDKEVFPDLKIGLLHGKLKDAEKDDVQQQFRDKKFDILVATSVVEVGVDIPNASVMMIEGAERFGLAQLHQFRGRVGRAEHQSYCFLFTTDELNSEDINNRLKYFEKHNDGFKLAEYDLERRGPGQVYGVEQSGHVDLKLATLGDRDIIKLARDLAGKVVENLADYPTVVAKIKDFDNKIHWE